MKPQVGDVIIVKQGIGVVRFVGEVDFDEGEYIGIEIKGNAVIGGNDGRWNNKKYFECRPHRGVFLKDVTRIISSEELLHKVAELYDILKGRRSNSHFIDRDSYDELLKENTKLRATINEYKEKLESVQELLNMMKFDFGNKLIETANLQDKISTAEQKLGKRLSKILISNENGNGGNNNTKNNNNNNSQSRQSQTLEDLNALGDFEQISYDIDLSSNNANNNKGARGSIVLDLNKNNNKESHDTSQVIPSKTQGKGFNITQDINIPSQHKTMHYRKFSGSTAQVLANSRAKKNNTVDSVEEDDNEHVHSPYDGNNDNNHNHNDNYNDNYNDNGGDDNDNDNDNDNGDGGDDNHYNSDDHNNNNKFPSNLKNQVNNKQPLTMLESSNNTPKITSSQHAQSIEKEMGTKTRGSMHQDDFAHIGINDNNISENQNDNNRRHSKNVSSLDSNSSGFKYFMGVD